jgi:ATP-binding cassette subfamily B protein
VSGGTLEPLTTRRTALIWAALRAHHRLSAPIFWGFVACAIAATALPLTTTVLIGAMVGAIPEGTDAVWPPLLAFAAVRVGTVPFDVGRWWLHDWMGMRYRMVHRERIMEVALREPGVAHLHDPLVLDAAAAADNVWVDNMLEGVMNVGVNRTIGLGGAVIVGVHQPLAALIMAAAWLELGRFRWNRGTEIHRVVTGQTQAMRRAEAVSGIAVEAAPAKEVRIFGLRHWLVERYRQEWQGAMDVVWAGRSRAARGMTLRNVALLAAHAVGLGLIIRDARAGAISLGALAAVLAAVHQMREIGEGVFGHYEIEFGVPLVTALRRFEAVVADRGDDLPGAPEVPRVVSEVRFDGVHFAYPASAREVLTGVDLVIPAGSSLAIVGVNGAGKTTLLQLLARLRDPTSGRITVDGVDLRTVDAHRWQSKIAAVSQQALRLPLSAADNLRSGRDLDTSALSEAAADAGIADVLEGLPIGWDTPLVRDQPGGMDLSGGQWQRLALARGLAALHAGAQVLVLDEPTAHLDVRAEADLYDRFLELTRGRTTILVSHRFSTVRRADRIAVLEHGQVVEIGSHDELMATPGRYAQMFRLQAARFEDVAPVPLESE